MSDSVSETPHRGDRCGICYWALYDGDWCQNKNCKMSGKSVNENRIFLSTDEAMILIEKGRIQMIEQPRKPDSHGAAFHAAMTMLSLGYILLLMLGMSYAAVWLWELL